jgi:hypothetical protein
MTAIVRVAVLAVFLGGCATTMYDGPARPDEATIVVNGMRLLRIDSRDAPSGQVFRIEPGRHAVAVDLNDDPTPGSERWRRSGEPLDICFDARPMRLYLIRPKYEGSEWLPEVLDQQANRTIATIPINHLHPSCEAQASGVVTPSETATTGHPGAPTVHGPRPTIELHLDAGDATGGDQVADSLGAGDGYLLGGGARFTPLWIGSDLGLGVGLDVLFKYASTSGGRVQASQSSMPTILTGHALIKMNHDPRWYLLVRGGLEMDFYRQSSFNGQTGSTLSRGAGLLADIGPMFEATDHIGVGAAVRLTLSQLPAGMDHISGSNIGIVVSVSYNFGSEKAREPVE